MEQLHIQTVYSRIQHVELLSFNNPITQFKLYFELAFPFVMDVKRPQILCSSSHWGEIYFPIPWIWKGPMTSFDQQNVVEVPWDFWAQPQEASELLLLSSWKAPSILWRRLEREDHHPIWGTRPVSEAMLDGPGSCNPQITAAARVTSGKNGKRATPAKPSPLPTHRNREQMNDVFLSH